MSYGQAYGAGYPNVYTGEPAAPVISGAPTTYAVPTDSDVGASVVSDPSQNDADGMSRQDYLTEFFNGTENIDEFHPRTLYVGNLDGSVSEEFLVSLFAQMGVVNKCKIIHETVNEPYAFIEFNDHNSAVQALTAMNRRHLLGKEMRVNWATSPGTQIKVDTSKHFHAFVGDLSPDIDNKTLRDAFAPFGDISDVKVIRDLQTLKSKGYGFVSFVRREDAERAIEQMNGQWLGRRTIRTNWATRRPGGIVSHDANGMLLQNPMGNNKEYNPKYQAKSGGTFEEVMSSASAQNCTVYVGGVNANTSDDDIRKNFVKFGNVLDIKLFKQQGFCFVRYNNKESAAQAIVTMNGSDINGSPVRCSWGKEGGGSTTANPTATNNFSNYGYGYANNYNNSATAAAQSYGAAANYWSQYYSNYYNNPAMYQQWAANYYQQPPQPPQQ